MTSVWLRASGVEAMVVMGVCGVGRDGSKGVLSCVDLRFMRKELCEGSFLKQ